MAVAFSQYYTHIQNWLIIPCIMASWKPRDGFSSNYFWVRLIFSFRFFIFSFYPFSFLPFLCTLTSLFCTSFYIFSINSIFSRLSEGRCVFFLLIQILVALGNKKNYFKFFFCTFLKAWKAFLALWCMLPSSAHHPLNKISSFLNISLQSFPCLLIYLFIQQIENPLHARHCSRHRE